MALLFLYMYWHWFSIFSWTFDHTNSFNLEYGPELQDFAIVLVWINQISLHCCFLWTLVYCLTNFLKTKEFSSKISADVFLSRNIKVLKNFGCEVKLDVFAHQARCVHSTDVRSSSRCFDGREITKKVLYHLMQVWHVASYSCPEK